jgi:hypothetical protein
VGTIRVEPETPTKRSTCAECGGTNQLLHGYVYDDEHPHGVYFVEWCDGDHPRRVAFLTLENVDDLWHVADHIVLDDARLTPVRHWLGAGGRHEG